MYGEVEMKSLTKKDLEVKVEELQKIIIEKNRELEKECQRNSILLAAADEGFRESPFYKQLLRDLEIMTEAKKTAERRLELSIQREEKLRDRLKELEKITSAPKHNARNAGRKKADEKWVQSFVTWQELYKSQKSINEIMSEMGISRATYYRYKKLYDETNTSN